MFGTNHRAAPVRGRSILALSSLALLAFCCLPVLAQASSAGAQYQDAAPGAPGGGSPNKSDLSGGSSSTSGIGSAAGGGDGSKGAKSSGGGKGSSSKSGDGTQSSQGSGDIGGNQGVAGENAAAPGTDSGGSSPLVPILIAIVVLAGGSVAYVMYKRRRAAADPNDPSSAVTPEAG